MDRYVFILEEKAAGRALEIGSRILNYSQRHALDQQRKTVPDGETGEGDDCSGGQNYRTRRETERHATDMRVRGVLEGRAG